MAPMLRPHATWRFPAPAGIDGRLAAAGAAAGLSARIVGILARRGIATPDDLMRFIGSPELALGDPRLLPDAEVFVERIDAAARRSERILVFGDFDADGLSGLATMTRALRRRGLDVMPYVPSRLDEGHGLSRRAIDVAADGGASVIVTVDCGSTSGPEIAAASGRGIDVLVTDHHRVPAVLPPAAAIVNPQRTDRVYPDNRLSGSGVAFQAATLVLEGQLDAAERGRLAQLALLGTVSDVAPILGENRAIAKLGLGGLRGDPLPGLRALLARAGIAPATVDLETVGFSIAPRLNAAGRVGDADDAARLLLTDDPAEAAILADRLEVANGVRRELTRQAVDEAERQLAATTADGPAIVVRGSWPVGIVGLVAARLAESRRRPAVVGANLGDVVRASCRGAGAIDLGAALVACSDLLIRHGGHAGAAGFEIDATRWEEFEARFTALAAAAPPATTVEELWIDVAMPAADVDYDLFRELATLEPTGTGNPPPLVAALGATVARVRAASGGHTQLTLRRDRDVVDAIAFDRPDLATTLHDGDRIDVVARLVSRTFGGFETLQFEIRDVAPAGFHPAAASIQGRLPAMAAS